MTTQKAVAILFMSFGLMTLAIAILSHAFINHRPTGFEDIPLLTESIAYFAASIAISVLTTNKGT